MAIETQRPRVLAVDDEEQILVSINDLLEDDFEVRTANSGARALEILHKDRCAVIVTDQRMPEMTGDEFLFKAQEISGASRVLGQVSEFSLLIAVLALEDGLIGTQASYLVQATTLLTFAASTYYVVLTYPTPVAISDRLRRD
jgi:DNA-binding NtrC family response regulator